MNQFILTLLMILSILVMILIGSLPRQMQNFSNDLTVQNKKAGYWKTRTGIKLTVLFCAIIFAIILFALMVINYGTN